MRPTVRSERVWKVLGGNPSTTASEGGVPRGGRAHRALAGVLLLGALAAGGRVAAQDYDAQEYTMACDDMIPTTKWGERYARGRVSALVLFGNDGIGYGFFNRRLQEFQRALDGDIEYARLAVSATGGSNVDNARAIRLLDSRRWDVILSWVEWEGHQGVCGYGAASDEVKARVLSQVNDGAGLIFFGSGQTPPAALCSSNRLDGPLPASALAGLALSGRAARQTEPYTKESPPIAAEPSFQNGFASLYRLGKGRVVVLAQTDVSLGHGSAFQSSRVARPVASDYRIDPDYLHAELIRAVWFAANKPPEVEFTATPPAVWTAALGHTRGQTNRWTLHVIGPKRDLTARWRIRDLVGQVSATGTNFFPNATGRVECPITLPALDAGWHQLDVFVDSPRGRETFGYSGIHVPPPYRVSLERDRIGVPPGEEVSGRALIESAGHSAAAPGVEQLKLALVDNHDRVLARTAHRVAPGRAVSFRFPTSHSSSLQLRVVATARAGGRVAARAETTFQQLDRGHDRFNVVLWGAPDGIYAHWTRRRLWQTGVTVCMNLNAPYPEDANLAAMPFFIGGWGWEGAVDGKKFKGVWGAVRPHPVTGVLTHALLPDFIPACLNDPGRFAQMLDAQQHYFDAGTKHPIFLYNLYDEGVSSAMCLDPHCLAAYRGWLKQQYHDDLAALNAEWGSRYQTWDEVHVLDPADWKEENALAAGHRARWSDRKHFGEVNFCRRVLGAQTERARQTDPAAKLGFEGSGGFGMDFDELLAHSGFWCPYDSIVVDLLRGLKPPGYISSFWIGYDKEAPPLLTKAWRAVLAGSNSIWWWMLPGRGGFHGWLAPNDEPFPARQQLIEQCVLPLRRGLGDLLLRLDMPHDGIGLYYSVASVHAQSWPGADQFNGIESAFGSFARLIEDCGFQWTGLTKQRLLRGDAQRQGLRLLILPCAQALGSDEVGALRRFVHAGGIVVADLRPGVCSGHARPLERGPADELFGVTRTGPGKAIRISGRTTTTLRNQPIPLTLERTRADAQLAAASARAGATLEGAPVFLVHSLGAGEAVLLNFHLSQFGSARGGDWGGRQREFFRALAAAAGIRPRVTLRRADGGDAPLTRCVSWTKGGVTVLAIARDGSATEPVEVAFPSEQFVFDLRSGRGQRTGRVTLDGLRPDCPAFLAAYPYDPGSPQVQADQSNAGGGEVVTFSIRMSGVPATETGVFSFHTRLLNPRGEWVDVIPWSAQGAGGAATVTVRLAHNDPVGSWKLEAREITTGRLGSATVEVR